MWASKHTLENVDPDLWQAMKGEVQRQEEYIELIASENYASPAVMQAQGSVLTNKYAEGYPGKRYYGGCEYVDVVEQLAIERLKALFDAEYVNVQPHSGLPSQRRRIFDSAPARRHLSGHVARTWGAFNPRRFSQPQRQNLQCGVVWVKA